MEDIPNYVLYIILFILLIIVLLFVLKYKFNWSFKISIGRKDAEVIKSDEVNNSNVTESKDNVTKIDEKDKQEIIDEVVKNVENKIENFRSINEEEIESKSETIDKIIDIWSEKEKPVQVQYIQAPPQHPTPPPTEEKQ